MTHGTAAQTDLQARPIAARLTENDPGRLQLGAEVELVLEPLYREADGTDVLTFAFRPVESGE